MPDPTDPTPTDEQREFAGLLVTTCDGMALRTDDDLASMAELIRARDLRVRGEERARVLAEQWIPVGARLPERLTAVMFSDSKGRISFGMLNGNWYDLMVDDGHDARVKDVAYWQPLPEPPSGDATGGG